MGMFPSSYLVFTIQSVVHICWKKYLLDLQETISHEACVSMRSWGKVWVSQNHSSLFDVPRKTQNGLMCRANCKMTWCGAQIISGHYSAHKPIIVQIQSALVISFLRRLSIPFTIVMFHIQAVFEVSRYRPSMDPSLYSILSTLSTVMLTRVLLRNS